MEQTPSDTSPSQNQDTEFLKEELCPTKSLPYSPIDLKKTKGRLGKPHLTDEQTKFILTAYVYTKRPTYVSKLFLEKYGKPISYGAVYNMMHRKKNQNYIQRVVREYETSISNVFLASRRQRIEEMGKRYMALVQNKNHSAAAKCLRDIDDMMTNAKRQDINILNITQNNSFTSMSYSELCEEEARLVKELKHVMLNYERKKEPKQVEYEINGDRS